jgi:hypothetical protein
MSQVVSKIEGNNKSKVALFRNRARCGAFVILGGSTKKEAPLARARIRAIFLPSERGRGVLARMCRQCSLFRPRARLTS